MTMLDFLFRLYQVLSLVFLFPLQDRRGRYKTFPYMTALIILLNVVVFLGLNLLPRWIDIETLIAVVESLLLRPVDVLAGEGLGALSMITAAFMHFTPSHLIGNMLILFFFGRKLEDVLGPAKFALFYLACAFVAGVASVLGWSALPVTQGQNSSVGASGAIMGVVGAYLFLYSSERIRTVFMITALPIPFFPWIPAWVYIIYSMARDVLLGQVEKQLQLMGVEFGGIDVFAHMGGIIAGLTLIYFFLPAEILHYRHQVGDKPRS